MTDHQTLIDLNIIPGNASAFSLKEKLDYCQTQGGKDHLKKLLKLESITYTEILERQSCIKFICHQPAKWRMPVSENEIFYLKQYLNTAYEPLTEKNKLKTVFISIKRLLFNREQYYFTLSGIKSTLRVLREIVLLCRTVYDPLMPDSLKGKLQAVQEASASLGIGERIYNRFLHEEPNPAEVFTLDHVLRTKHRDKIADILAIYYQLEVYYSLARANVSLKLTFPELADAGADIYLKELFHPLVEGCNTNTIRTDGRNMIIITGPNMSGKSTFMKSVGIAFVMAYLGMGVPAAAATIPVVDVIITCIDIKDDIEKGYSYFFSEVKRIKSIAEKIHTGKRVIVIGDELFKGTNVQDALDCTAMVLQGFLQHSGNFYFIATHFTEIAERFQTAQQCYPVCFDGKIEEEKILFDYRLNPGISTLRVGCLILKQQQVLKLLDPMSLTTAPSTPLPGPSL